jgi:SAM-dependent methyltransferase
LSPRIDPGTSAEVSVPQIFDPQARRTRARRAAGATASSAWLIARASEEIAIRLSAIRREFASILLLTPVPRLVAPDLPSTAKVVTFDHVSFDEDRLPFANASFDCIISIGMLDTVNDLPGALTLLRRALTSDGVLIAAMAGAGSLRVLREAMAEADPGRAHFHPQIDVRAMGDLLLRAGFAQPVVDVDSVDARYSRLASLIADLRANAQTNILAGRAALPKRAALALETAYSQRAIDGRITESFATIHATGWASAA